MEDASGLNLAVQHIKVSAYDAHHKKYASLCDSCMDPAHCQMVAGSESAFESMCHLLSSPVHKVQKDGNCSLHLHVAAALAHDPQVRVLAKSHAPGETARQCCHSAQGLDIAQVQHIAGHAYSLTDAQCVRQLFRCGYPF